MSTCSMGKCVTFLYVIIFTHLLNKCHQSHGAAIMTYGYKLPQKGLKEYESSIHPKYNNYLYPIDVYQNPLIGEDITQQFTKIIKDKMDKPDASYRMKKTRHKHSMNQYVSSDHTKKKQFDMYQNPMIGEDITQQFSKIIKEKLKNTKMDAPHKREVGNQSQQQQDESGVQTECPAEVQSSRRISQEVPGCEIARISRQQGNSDCSEAEQPEQSSNDDEDDDSSKDTNSSNHYLKQNLHVQYPSVRGSGVIPIVPKLNSDSNNYSNAKSESKLDIDEDLHPGVQSLRQSSSYPENAAAGPNGSMEQAANENFYQNHSSLMEMQKARPFMNSDGEGPLDPRINLAQLQSNSQGKLSSTTSLSTTYIFSTNKSATRTIPYVTAVGDAPLMVSMLQMGQRPVTATPKPGVYIQGGKGNMGAAPNVGSVITQIYNMLVQDGSGHVNAEACVTGPGGGYELKAREKEVEVRFFGNPSTMKYPGCAGKFREVQN